MVNNLRRFLAKGSITDSNKDFIKSQLDIFFKIIPKPKYPIMPSQLERLTINNKVPPFTTDRINNIEYIKYPKPQFVKYYGRCNMIGQPVFYGGFNLLTSAGETRPEIGVYFTHSEWKLKTHKPINVFPIFYPFENWHDEYNALSQEIRMLHNKEISKLSDLDKKGVEITMEFLADSFSKDVAEENDLDYYISAYLSNLILNSTDLGYDGILYPSVKMKLGFSNLAIKPDIFDSLFIPTEVRYEKNTIPPGGSGFNYVINRADKFDFINNLILWEE